LKASASGPSLPLSLDWEDWYQLCCPPFDAADAHDRFEDRLVRATELALELCHDLGAQGTWFCLADQARRHPGTVRRIADAGHRIGVHGYTHTRAFQLDQPTFRESLKTAKTVLEDITGCEVLGFRAPEWSLRGAAADWWRMLPDLGFRFDSSRAPLKVIGDPAWPRRPHRLPNGLWELPPPVMGLGPLTVPMWGWAMRLWPEPLLRARLEALGIQRAGTPLVLHPWELDAGQPRLPEVSEGHRFAHAAGLKGYGDRLRRLWKGLALEPLEAWIQAQESAEATGPVPVLAEALP
jgi:polysaccharide deacetylase family protein (PEP-CTERM system associated)